MPRYKRSAAEAQLDISLEPQPDPKDAETLSKLRNMWEFASLMQYIFMFGHVVKIDDDFDVEDLEAECLKPQSSEQLSSIGLALLKYVSSHRGLTPEIFDEYARRQYEAKAPKRNPFGEGEDPAKFADFDVFTKIRVLQQLSTWTFTNAERIRNLMPEDEEHLSWRMEPLGWDKDDRQYYVLDDNRLYRRTDAPLPPPSPKPASKSKPKSKAKKSSSKTTRSSKRRKIETPEPEEEEDAELGAQDDTVMTEADAEKKVEGEQDEYGDGFGGLTWECVAITLEEYQDFLSTIFRSRDPNEKRLRTAIEQDVIPIIEKRAEAQRQKHLRKIRELENVQKLATAKRSSRLAGKAEKEKEEREAREAEERRLADLRMAHEEQERQKRIEEGHESRRLTREQRLKEREVKRILHEEELAKLEADSQRALSQDPNSAEAAADQAEKKRLSERHIRMEKEKHKAELERLAEEEDKWVFDCAVCGMHGENLDDGSHSISCENCGVWQHSKCHHITPKQAEKEDFHFVCSDCKRKEEDAKKPKIKPLKLNMGRGTSGSPKSERSDSRPPNSAGLPPHVQRQLDGVYIPQQPRASPGYAPVMNGPSLSPQGQTHGPPGYHSNGVPHYAMPPQQPWQGNPLPPPVRPPSSGYQSSPPPAMNGYAPAPRQQHQYAHQSAVASANLPPAHDGYRAQPNGYNHPGQGTYRMPPPAQAYMHTQYPMNGQHMGQPPQQQQQRPASSGQPQLMNGFQSPTKTRPSMSPPQQNAHAYQQQHRQPLTQSPNASFPPPTHDGFSVQRAGYSPMKSSSPPQHPQQSYAHQPHPPHNMQTPTNLRPPSANGSVQRTPDMRPTSNGTPINGMSGPWPVVSKVIPEKHDSSPAPPSSAHTVGETPVIPPVAALSPSPGMHGGSVPVKKPMPEVPALNGQGG